MEEVKKEKPDPEGLLKAKHKLRVKIPIYIGDTINDCLAAKSAGMLSIFIGKEILGDYQINNVNKLKGMIL